ncbi:MAG: hypothetical protein R2844_05050 [Caldilineales bacterium]
MYGLVVVWSILALLAAARWLRIGGTGQGRGGWLAVYVAALTLALYTQYYAAFLAAGLALAGLLALWRRREGMRAALIWLGVQAVVALLYLPWLLYAAPRLVPYVSQKIVADSDRPLGASTYLARHLAAYAVGHLEGPLAGWWPLGILPALLAVVGLLMLVRRWRAAGSESPAPWSPSQAIGFLLVVLAMLLLLGWLVNLSFPFFPERGERLLLLGQPVFLVLLACILAAGARGLRLVSIGVLAALSAVSLAAFYTVPRYAGEDYRPLIGQVNQWGRPEDTVFAVFPWQVGYWWSYGAADGPQPLLSPSDDWSAAAQAALDGALSRGRVWFPEHLSLGGFFETAAEDYLARRAAVDQPLVQPQHAAHRLGGVGDLCPCVLGACGFRERRAAGAGHRRAAIGRRCQRHAVSRPDLAARGAGAARRHRPAGGRGRQDVGATRLHAGPARRG